MSDPRIPCDECRELVSVEASVCSHCGNEFLTKERLLTWIFLYSPIVAIGIPALLLVVLPDVIIQDVGGTSTFILIGGVLLIVTPISKIFDYLERQGDIREVRAES